MSTDHRGGNIQNEITLEEHDGVNNAKRVNVVSGTITASSQVTVTLNNTPTLFAVVNTSAAGQASIVLDRGHQFIGIVTVANPGSFSGNVTLDAGSKTQIVGNVTLSDAKTFIGLVTAKAILYAEDGTALNHSGGNLLTNVQNFAVGQFSNTATVATNLTSALVMNQNQIYDGANWVRWNGIVTVANPASANLSGNVTLDPGSRTGVVGNLTLSDSKGFIGLVTVGNTVTVDTELPTAAALSDNTANPTLPGVGAYILGKNAGGSWDRLVAGTPSTTDNTDEAGTLKTIAFNAMYDAGGDAWPALRGETTNGLDVDVTRLPALPAGANFIGLVSVGGGVLNTVSAVTDITNPVAIKGNLTLSDSKAFIGLVTVNIGSSNTVNTELPAAAALGDTDANPTAPAVGSFLMGWDTTQWTRIRATIGDGAAATGILNVVPMAYNGSTYDRVRGDTNGVYTRNAGTTKTLVNLPIAMSTGSVATIAVPTTNQRIKVANLVLNSDATVRVAFKSGVTYLTGNASIGITLNPGGGWIQTGAPDSPSWIGLPSGAFVIEKLDLTGTVAKIGGNVIYFDEA